MEHFVLIRFGSDVAIGVCFSTNDAETVDFNVDFLLLLEVSSIDDFCDMAKAENQQQKQNGETVRNENDIHKRKKP